MLSLLFSVYFGAATAIARYQLLRTNLHVSCQVSSLQAFLAVFTLDKLLWTDVFVLGQIFARHRHFALTAANWQTWTLLCFMLQNRVSRKRFLAELATNSRLWTLFEVLHTFLKRFQQFTTEEWTVSLLAGADLHVITSHVLLEFHDLLVERAV